MFSIIKNLFNQESTDYALLASQGAKIIDVRSPGEFAGGHIKGSINIPLDSLSQNLKKLGDPKSPIILCCASGMRSGSAKGMLEGKGFTQVYNGGGWQSLSAKVGK